MSSFAHSRECGKATALSVPSFEADLVAECWKCGSRRLNAVSRTVAKYIFLLLTTYNVYLVLVFQKSALLLPLAPTVETRATEFRFSSRCPRRHLLTVRAGLDIVAATVFSDRTAEEQSTLYGDCCCYRATYELPNHSLKNSYERARARSTAVKIHLTTAQETANSMEPHLQVSATSSASKEGTETAVALPHSRECAKEPYLPCQIWFKGKLRN